MLPLLDAGDEPGDIEGVRSECPGGDLAMEHGGGDIGVVGRGLTPADLTGLGRQSHEADELVGEGLELGDPAHDLRQIPRKPVILRTGMNCLARPLIH